MPLSAPEAKKLIRVIIEEGTTTFSAHAHVEMAKDNLTEVDGVNACRAGSVREGEWENGSWRYQVVTGRMVFVVTFDPEPECKKAEDANVAETELIIVTAWRTK